MPRQANLVTATMATPRRIRPWQLLRPRSRTDHVIGLQIDTRRVYAVHSFHTDSMTRIAGAYEADLDKDTICDGMILKPNRIVEALRTLRTQMDGRCVPRDSRVVLLTDGHRVITKRLCLPQMTDKEVEEGIRWEAEMYIPFDIYNANVDWEPLVSNVVQSGREVLLVAARRDAVDDLARMVCNAGWMLDAVECVGQGLQRLAGPPEQEGHEVAIVYIGDDLLHLVITNAKSEIGFTRSISIGRSDLIKEVSKTLNCSSAEADTFVASPDRLAQCPNEMRVLFERACQTVIEQIALELMRTLTFHQSTVPDVQIDRILISGRDTDLPAFQRIIEQRLEISTSHIVLSSNIPHRFALATGLSLRTHFDDLRTAQQVDRERKKTERERRENSRAA